MAHYCQGLNPFPRDTAQRLFEQRLAEARQQHLAQDPGLLPWDTPFTRQEVETKPDWMNNLSAEGWNDMTGGSDMDEDA